MLEDRSISSRARKLLLILEKQGLLSKDVVHSPFNLEIVCASMLTDKEFRFGKEISTSQLFDNLFGWLSAASPDFDSETMLASLCKGFFLFSSLQNLNLIVCFSFS